MATATASAQALPTRTATLGQIAPSPSALATEGTPATPQPTPTPAAIGLEGDCARPGPQGLIACDHGTRVAVYRCDDETRCLHDASAVLLAETTVAAGIFRLPIVGAAEWSRRVVIAAEVPDGAGTAVYRTVIEVRDGELGSSAAIAVSTPIRIDPSAEGSTRAADVAGLDNVAEAALRDLEMRTRADARADYSGLSSSRAAERAQEIAVDILFGERIEPFGVAVSGDGRDLYISARGVLALLERDLDDGDLSIRDVALQGVRGNDGLAIGVDVAVSPDGAQAYVANYTGSVAVYARDPLDGRLCMKQILRDGQDGVRGISSAQAVGVSPDGLNVYVVGGGSIGVFSRDPETGLLIFSDAVATGHGFIPHLGISADGTALYVVGFQSLNVFSRKSGGGLERVSEDPCDFCLGVVVSADHRDVYVASSPDQHDSFVHHYTRDTASGQLSQSASVLVGSFASLAIADDGRDVYAMSANAHLDAFARDLGSGALSHVGEAIDPATLEGTVEEVRDLAVSPDGRNVYAVARYARGLSIFDRGSDGTPTFRRFVQIPSYQPLNLSGSIGALAYAETWR